jgi:hypothetical protein
MPEKLFKGMVNPLAFLEVDKPWALVHLTEVSSEIILKYMCPTTRPSVDNLIEKYREVSVENPRLNVVPAEDRILEKLIWPLRHANIGVLSGNHIRPLIRKIIGVTLFQRSAYVCMKKGCYADSRALVGSYLETIYT